MRNVIGCTAVAGMLLHCTSCWQGTVEVPSNAPSNVTVAAVPEAAKGESVTAAPEPAKDELVAAKDPLAYLDQFAASTETNAATEESYGVCGTCHVDVVDAFVGSAHCDEGMGCADCHGSSKAHIADENNEVKPDRIFAQAGVVALCMACHECSRAQSASEPTEAPKVCTDCHAAH